MTAVSSAYPSSRVPLSGYATPFEASSSSSSSSSTPSIAQLRPRPDLNMGFQMRSPPLSIASASSPQPPHVGLNGSAAMQFRNARHLPAQPVLHASQPVPAPAATPVGASLCYVPKGSAGGLTPSRSAEFNPLPHSPAILYTYEEDQTARSSALSRGQSARRAASLDGDDGDDVEDGEEGDDYDEDDERFLDVDDYGEEYFDDDTAKRAPTLMALPVPVQSTADGLGLQFSTPAQPSSNLTMSPAASTMAASAAAGASAVERHVAYLQDLLAQHGIKYSASASFAASPSVVKSPAPTVDDTVLTQYLMSPSLNLHLKNLISSLSPNKACEARRLAVVTHFTSLIRKNFGAQVYPSGDYGLKTYLQSTTAIDLSVFFSRQHDHSWIQRIINALVNEHYSAYYASTSADGAFDQSAYLSNSHTAVQSVAVHFTAYQQPVVSATLGGIRLHVTGNNVVSLGNLALLELVDQRVGKEHLFKKTILLLQAWARKAKLLDATAEMGATGGAGTQALLSSTFIKTLVLFIFNAFHARISTPLQGILQLLQYLQFFDWDNHALTIFGPVKLSALEEGRMEAVRSLEVPTAWPKGITPLLDKEVVRQYLTIPNHNVGSKSKEWSQSQMNSADKEKDKATLPTSASAQSLSILDHSSSSGMPRASSLTASTGSSSDIPSWGMPFMEKTLSSMALDALPCQHHRHPSSSSFASPSLTPSQSAAELQQLTSQVYGQFYPSASDRVHVPSANSATSHDADYDLASDLVSVYDLPVDLAAAAKRFSRCSLNVFSPLELWRNLGSEIDYKNEFRIRRAMQQAMPRLKVAMQTAVLKSREEGRHAECSKDAFEISPNELDTHPLLSELFEPSVLEEYKETQVRQQKKDKLKISSPAAPSDKAAAASLASTLSTGTNTDSSGESSPLSPVSDSAPATAAPADLSSVFGPKVKKTNSPVAAVDSISMFPSSRDLTAWSSQTSLVTAGQAQSPQPAQPQQPQPAAKAGSSTTSFGGPYSLAFSSGSMSSSSSSLAMQSSSSPNLFSLINGAGSGSGGSQSPSQQGNLYSHSHGVIGYSPHGSVSHHAQGYISPAGSAHSLHTMGANAGSFSNSMSRSSSAMLNSGGSPSALLKDGVHAMSPHSSMGPATGSSSYDSLDGGYERIVANFSHAKQFSSPQISEMDLLGLIEQILLERGSVPVGRLGSLLHEATNNHSLPAMLKEQFGGLKRLLEQHPELFIVSRSHPYNPNVSLKAQPNAPLAPSNGSKRKLQRRRTRTRRAGGSGEPTGSYSPVGTMGGYVPSGSMHSMSMSSLGLSASGSNSMTNMPLSSSGSHVHSHSHGHNLNLVASTSSSATGSVGPSSPAALRGLGTPSHSFQSASFQAVPVGVGSPMHRSGHTAQFHSSASSPAMASLPSYPPLSSSVAPPSSSSPGSSPPVLTPVVALDCEMVGVGSGGLRSLLARCSIVNSYGDCIYDKYVTPSEPITDFRTAVSGIIPSSFANAIDFKVAQREIASILKGRVVVGHGLLNDFQSMMISHPQRALRDVAYYRPLCPTKPMPLRRLAWEKLGVDIQSASHDSVEDARTALLLYRSVEKEWETHIASVPLLDHEEHNTSVYSLM